MKTSGLRHNFYSGALGLEARGRLAQFYPINDQNLSRVRAKIELKLITYQLSANESKKNSGRPTKTRTTSI